MGRLEEVDWDALVLAMHIETRLRPLDSEDDSDSQDSRMS